MNRSTRTPRAFETHWSDPAEVLDRHAEPTRFVLAVPGENAERVFDNWQTATRHAASAAARLRSSGRIEDARNVTISEA